MPDFRRFMPLFTCHAVFFIFRQRYCYFYAIAAAAERLRYVC